MASVLTFSLDLWNSFYKSYSFIKFLVSYSGVIVLLDTIILEGNFVELFFQLVLLLIVLRA